MSGADKGAVSLPREVVARRPGPFLSYRRRVLFLSRSHHLSPISIAAGVTLYAPVLLSALLMPGQQLLPKWLISATVNSRTRDRYPPRRPFFWSRRKVENARLLRLQSTLKIFQCSKLIRRPPLQRASWPRCGFGMLSPRILDFQAAATWRYLQ